MEVCRGNWRDRRDLIKEAVMECDYCALDFEFTGLNTGKQHAFHQVDTSEERYGKASMSSKNFSVSQIGISCFTKVNHCNVAAESAGTHLADDSGPGSTSSGGQASQVWRVKTFNAYLFPGYVPNPTSISTSPSTSGSGQGAMYDSRFMCQGASISFLAKANFDFNKWARESIYFVSCQTVSQWRYQLNQKKKSQMNAIVSSRILKNKDLEDRIRLWVLSVGETGAEREEQDKGEDLLGEGTEGGDSYNNNTLELSSLYGFGDIESLRETLTRAIGEGEHTCFTIHCRRTFTTEEPSVADKSGGGALKVIQLKMNEAKASQIRSVLKQIDERLCILNEWLGMSELLHFLQDAGCPVVVHNGMMDLMHLMQQFHGSTPLQWTDFKKTLRTLVPGGVFDTKVIASELSSMRKDEGDNPSLPKIAFDANLQQLHETLVKRCINPLVVYHEDAYNRYHNSEEAHHHEAGYDAYLTGHCFASLLQCYGSVEEGEIVGLDPMGVSESSSQASGARKFFGAVNEWHNKIHAMNSDYRYFDLLGEDPEPSRENWLHVVMNKDSKQWPALNHKDVASKFKNCGVQNLSVFSCGRNRSEALVKLPDIKAASQVLKVIQFANTEFKTTSYKVWRSQQQQQQQQQQENHQRGGNNNINSFSPSYGDRRRPSKRRRISDHSHGDHHHHHQNHKNHHHKVEKNTNTH